MGHSWQEQFQSAYNAQSWSHADGRQGIESEILDSTRDLLADALFGASIWMIEASIEACESPIEEAMLAALCLVALHEADGIELKSSLGHISHLGATGEAPHVGLLESQFGVGKYRADFRLECRNRWGYGDLFGAGEILIECDGHDFHERSKKQARRDRLRDRELQRDGFKVFRFTGSEIWADPIKCAQEAWSQAAIDAHVASNKKFDEERER